MLEGGSDRAQREQEVVGGQLGEMLREGEAYGGQLGPVPKWKRSACVQSANEC